MTHNYEIVLTRLTIEDHHEAYQCIPVGNTGCLCGLRLLSAIKYTYYIRADRASKEE